MKKIEFTTTIHKFGKNGDKTGWTYIDIPADLAHELKPDNKQSFRVKGKLDDFRIEGISLIPAGNGAFIMALNAALRKGIAKKEGGMLRVQLQEDKKSYQLNSELLLCLEDDPAALSFFNSLTPSHRNYFSKWIDSAKTPATQAKRIAQAIAGLAKKMDYGAMIRSNQQKNQR